MAGSAATSYLIIDGHSVIHSWPELRKLHSVAARRHLAREELMKRMRHLQDMSGARVVVVFDGIGSRITEEREDKGLQVFYADQGRTADAVIERLAFKYARKTAIRVVTADGMVRDSVGASGADWVSPEMLKVMCEDAEREMGKWVKKGKRGK